MGKRRGAFGREAWIIAGFIVGLSACDNDPDIVRLDGGDGRQDGGWVDDGGADAPDARLEPGFDAMVDEVADAAVQDAIAPIDDPPFDGGVSDSGDAGSPSPDAGVVLEEGALPVSGYLASGDSPFSGVAFDFFFLDDFEDGELNTPGVSDNGQGRPSSSFGASLIDSVDEDDGDPTDGRCVNETGTCNAWWGAGSLTFSFDAETLGAAPTHAGAVWTDGAGKVGFEVYDTQGAVVFSIEPFSEPGFPDNTVSSSTAEDRFFGAYVPSGISAIRIFNTAGGVEVDHLQYGRATP
jgi:hypothetical protein